MSKFERLRIYGIRNFGPDNEKAGDIHFMSPVTLIMGRNGCGKTTIIEALKYVCTNQLPPNSDKGQSFVYDPALLNRPFCSGQIKLEASCSNKTTMTVCKNVKVSEIKGKYTFSLVDSSFTKKTSKGDKKSISGRCVDIESQIVSALGVSKSVLNNVILCPQYDSCWPLEERSKVKARFDEIFDSTKYNKCLEVVRKLFKTKNTELKVLKEKVTNAADRKNVVDEKKKSLQKTRNKIQESSDIISECEIKLKPLQTKLASIRELEELYQDRRNKYKIKKSELETLKKFMNNLSKNIELFIGSDEELKQTILQFNDRVHLKESQLKELENKIEDIIAKENNILSDMKKEQLRSGQLQQEEQQNNVRKSTIKELIEVIANQLMTTPDSDIDSTLKNIRSKIIDKREDIKDLIKMFENQENHLQKQIDESRDNKVKGEQNIKSKENQLTELKRELKKVKLALEDATQSSDKLERIEIQLERNGKEYETLLKSFNTDEVSKKIKEEEIKRDGLEQQLITLDDEIKQLHLVANAQTEFELNRNQLDKAESEARRLFNSTEDTLQHLFNENIPQTDLQTSFDVLKKKFEAQIKNSDFVIDKAQKKLNELESDVNLKKHTLKNLKDEQVQCEKKIKQQCGNEPYFELRKKIELDLDKLQQQKGNYSNSKYMYNQFIEALEEEKPCCPLCHRDFNENPTALVKEIRELIEDFPNRLISIERDLTTKQAQYNKLVQLNNDNDRISILKKDIPTITKELEKLENDLQKTKDEIETLQKNRSVPFEKLQKANNISSDVTILSKCQAELPKLKTKVAELEEKIPANPSNRSVETATLEQERLKADMTAARKQIDVLQRQLTSFNDQKHKLQEKKNALIKEQLEIQKNAQGRVQLHERLKELQIKENTMNLEIDSLKEELIPLAKEFKDLNIQLIEMKNENKKNISEKNSEVNDIEKSFHQIEVMQKDIEQYTRKNITQQLSVSQKNLNSLEAKKNQCLVEKSELQNKADEIKKLLANQSGQLQNYKSNQDLRKNKKEEESLMNELKILEAELKKGNSDSLMLEINKIQKEMNIFCQSKIKEEGKLFQLNEAKTELETELALESNLKAAEIFHNMTVRYEVEVLAAKDLKTFANSLEDGLLKYHRDKIEQINRSIRSLWAKVYKGNDIDYFEIRADIKSEAVRSKNYEYRLVQIKGNTEQDMRGRCSAGQGMLASIIVRLALAETFSAACGVLALDEPTTNLDKANVIALSEALTNIVAEREQSSNFQLIIITHDDEFLKALASENTINSYFEVRRNREGMSEIEQKYARP